MKSFVLKLKKTIDKVLFVCFKLLIRRKNYKKILILDIDNTISDTWTYKYSKNNNKGASHSLYSSLPAFFRMRKYILDNFRDFKVIYLSARSYKLYFKTIDWLRSNDYPLKNNNVILVNNVKAKLYYINYLLSKGHEITYIDDLSYNHENDEVLFYDQVLEKLDKSKIKYLGYLEIEKIIKTYH